MRFGPAVCPLILLTSLGGALGAGPGALPAGRQHVLTIEGENTVTFIPQARVAPHKVDYTARVEYIVNYRTAEQAAAAEPAASKKKTTKKSTSKAKASAPANSPSKATAALDVSVHSSEARFRQNGQTVVESRMSRSRFQGRVQPEAPAINVSANEAPPRLQEMLKAFDTTAATMLLDDDSKVVDRKLRPDAPFHAVVETLLSIHTPVPRDAAFWEAPTQLAMGQGQTAKGTLRFEKQKQSLEETKGLVNVKVSGVLKAEGVVVGKFIKDGSYTVTGEQAYDPALRQWKTARWSVAVANELANPGGLTVAHARGTMTVTSKAVDGNATRTPEEADAKTGK